MFTSSRRPQMYIDLYKGQKRIHRQEDPSPYSLVGYIGYLDGDQVTELSISTRTIKLNMSVHGQEIKLSFTDEAISGSRNVTVPRATAVEMALYFLKNKGLPQK